MSQNPSKMPRHGGEAVGLYFYGAAHDRMSQYLPMITYVTA